MNKEVINNMENTINENLSNLKEINDVKDRVEMIKACNDTAKVLVENKKVDSQIKKDNKWYESPLFVETIKIGGTIGLQLLGIWATNSYMTRIFTFESDGKILVSSPGRKLSDIFRFKSVA